MIQLFAADPQQCSATDNIIAFETLALYHIYEKSSLRFNDRMVANTLSIVNFIKIGIQACDMHCIKDIFLVLLTTLHLLKRFAIRHCMKERLVLVTLRSQDIQQCG